MEMIPLQQAPDLIYTLPYVHGSIALALACAPDGAILRSRFAQSARAADDLALACRRLWPRVEIREAPDGFIPDTARCYLYGTPFQQSVWRYLLQLSVGSTVTYGQLAAAIGRPNASRAVGGAVGANPYAPFVPCHRVLAASGKIGGFVCGTELKRQLLALEGSAAI